MFRSLTRTIAGLLGVMALLAITPFAWSQQIIQQSTTSRKIAFLMIDSSDHITGKTGLTVTVTISKNGAAFAAPAGSVAELANGWYILTANSADTGTVGPLLLHASATGADPVDKEFNIVAYNPDDSAALGLSRIDVASSAIKSQTDKIGTNSGDSANAQTAQANAQTAATQSTAANTRAQLALPAVAPGAAGGLATGDANNAVKVQSGTGAGQISLSSGLVTVGTNSDKTGYTLTTGEHTTIQSDAAAGVLGASFLTVPGSSTTSGTQVVLTFRQWMALLDAMQGGDNVSTTPTANSTFTVTYYLRGASHISANIVYVATVSLDSNKNQTGRTGKVAQPFPAVN